MKKILILCIIFLISCSSGGGNNYIDIHTPIVKVKRIDVSYGPCKKGETCDYTQYEYLIGPEQTIYLHNTVGMNLRFIVHFYNEIPVKQQHIQIFSVTDMFRGNHGDPDLWLTATSDPPLIALTDENTQAWTGGWDVYLGGDLKLGEYQFCFWITDINGDDTDIHCFDVISEEGDGGLLENVDVNFMEGK